MKLQQRLYILRGQVTNQEEYPTSTQQQQQVLPVVHTDSGLRLIGDNALEANTEMMEIPPGYTAD